MKLLIDIGNTALKLALSNGNKIVRQIVWSSEKVIKAEEMVQKLQTAHLDVKQIKLIALSSVKPIWDRAIKKLAKQLNVPFYQVKHNLNVTDLKINLDHPQILGADLLMSAYGGFKKYWHRDLIIISLGTATTISMIKNGAFEGTIIMPGLKISAQILFEKAALLTKFNYQFSNKTIGKDSKEAINLGVVNGHLWAIKGLVNKIKKDLKKPLILIMGGNNYHYEQFFKKYHCEPNLLFEGMEFLLRDKVNNPWQ